MRYLKRFALVFSLLFVLFGATAMDASAQRRVYVRRPVFYHSYYGGGFGWGYNPYYYDPYLAARQEESARRSSVRHDEKVLRNHEEKYYADGVITDKERKKLADDKKDLSHSRRNLNTYYRDY
jgi:hypothetical protein